MVSKIHLSTLILTCLWMSKRVLTKSLVSGLGSFPESCQSSCPKSCPSYCPGPVSSPVPGPVEKSGYPKPGQPARPLARSGGIPTPSTCLLSSRRMSFLLSNGRRRNNHHPCAQTRSMVTTRPKNQVSTKGGTPIFQVSPTLELL